VLRGSIELPQTAPFWYMLTPFPVLGLLVGEVLAAFAGAGARRSATAQAAAIGALVLLSHLRLTLGLPISGHALLLAYFVLRRAWPQPQGCTRRWVELGLGAALLTMTAWVKLAWWRDWLTLGAGVALGAALYGVQRWLGGGEGAACTCCQAAGAGPLSAVAPACAPTCETREDRGPAPAGQRSPGGRWRTPALVGVALLAAGGAWLALPEGWRGLRQGGWPMALLLLTFVLCQAAQVITAAVPVSLRPAVRFGPALLLALLGVLGTQFGLHQLHEALTYAPAERRLELLARGRELAGMARMWGLTLAGLSAVTAVAACLLARAPRRPLRRGWVLVAGAALAVALLLGAQRWDEAAYARSVVQRIPSRRALAGGDVELARSSATLHPGDLAPLVVIGGQSVRVDGQPVVSRSALRGALGAEQELLVQPLLDALLESRRRAETAAAERHKELEFPSAAEPEEELGRRRPRRAAGGRPLLIVPDRATPFRELVRVAYTAGYANFDALHLGVGNPRFAVEPLRVVPLGLPRHGSREPRLVHAASGGGGLTIGVATQQVVVHAPSGPKARADGPARIAHLAGGPDAMTLYNHVRTLGDARPDLTSVTVFADSEVLFWQLVLVLDAMRTRLPQRSYQDRSVFERDLREAAPPKPGLAARRPVRRGSAAPIPAGQLFPHVLLAAGEVAAIATPEAGGRESSLLKTLLPHDARAGDGSALAELLAARDLPGSAGLPGLASSVQAASAQEVPAALPSVDPPGIGGEALQRAIRPHLGQVRFCYERELSVSPSMHGKVVLRFVVGPGGRVLDSSVHSSTLGRPGVGRCLVRAVRTWRFPKPAGGRRVEVRYPFVFAMRE